MKGGQIIYWVSGRKSVPKNFAAKQQYHVARCVMCGWAGFGFGLIGRLDCACVMMHGWCMVIDGPAGQCMDVGAW